MMAAGNGEYRREIDAILDEQEAAENSDAEGDRQFEHSRSAVRGSTTARMTRGEHPSSFTVVRSLWISSDYC